MDFHETMYTFSELANGFGSILGLVITIVSGIITILNQFVQEKGGGKKGKVVIGWAITACAFAITVVLFWGNSLVKVPDVTGYLCEDARQILINHGLKYDGSVETNQKIMDQNPRAGEIVNPGAIVELMTMISETVAGDIFKETQAENNKKQMDTGDFGNVSVGEIITFGTYEQDNNFSNGKENIEWIVLEKEVDRIFVITKYAIDRKQFHTSETAVTWENCYLRSWLNNDFFKSAFTREEQAIIPTVTVTADHNPKYENDPGNDTQDKMFILSTAEVVEYFPSKQSRICYTTEYAKSQGYLWLDGANDSVWWWLRTRGELITDATTVNTDGSIDFKDGKVNATSGTVRPVMWIAIG